MNSRMDVMEKIVLVFGNRDLPCDSFAHKVADHIHLERVRFIRCTVPDTVLDYLDRDNVYILDVVQGISDVILIHNIKDLVAQKALTLHDFDLGSFLLLLDACGTAGKIRIIGIPQSGDFDKIKEKVERFLS